MKLVTSYPSPDLDGTACSVAYAELLRKKGEEAIGALFGEPDTEAAYVADREGIKLENGSNYTDVEEVVLVDACRMGWIAEELDQEDVIEVIDHQKDHIELPQDVELQNELVGAAATLIAERFFESGEEISRESATLLYAAIVDNTVDFQADVTTERDIEAADRLEDRVKDPEELKESIFEAKSSLEGPVKEVISDDYYWAELGGYRVGISQLEAKGSARFARKNLTRIRESLEELEKEDGLDYCIANFFDIKTGENIVIAGKGSVPLTEEALDVELENGLAVNPDQLLRKQIKPRMETVLNE